MSSGVRGLWLRSPISLTCGMDQFHNIEELQYRDRHQPVLVLALVGYRKDLKKGRKYGTGWYLAAAIHAAVLLWRNKSLQYIISRSSPGCGKFRAYN